MNDQDKIENSWKSLKRIDDFISATNNKGTILLAFNTFVLGAIILKWDFIVNMFSSYGNIQFVIELLLFIIAASSIFSTYKLFKIINPFLYSYNAPNKYHSRIFFNHIEEYKSPDEYYNDIKSISNEDLLKDIVYQIHSLSKGIKEKYISVGKATNSILFISIPTISLIFIIKIILTLFLYINNLEK